MNLWGLVMAGVGCFFLISGWLKSDFFIYRICVARSKPLPRGRVQRARQLPAALLRPFL